jgi:hypothetical protein
MLIRLEKTGVDPRIYDVLIDFTGYPKDTKYFPWFGTYSRWQSTEVPTAMLDNLLEPLKLRRLGYWRPMRVQRGRINIYTTAVISDRMNKRNDVD